VNKGIIYDLTARINNCLHFEFGMKDLFHRMNFTASALLAVRRGAIHKGMTLEEFRSGVLRVLVQEIKEPEPKEVMTRVFSEVRSGVVFTSTEENTKRKATDLLGAFIGWVEEISSCLESSEWQGEDVLGIFFNEFTSYKGKADSGQVFTPEHITGFMYKILGVSKEDRVLDAACGTGGFLLKAMSQMLKEADADTDDDQAHEIKTRLYGIEFDRDVFALAYTNMLIQGSQNIRCLDSRTEEAMDWVKEQGITKVLMNPPFESKWGCMTIVENVLNAVPTKTSCAFILPDKKLEKTSKSQMKRILATHRLLKVVKLPEDIFIEGITTSIFIFETGTPQNGSDFFACYMSSDGLATVKNKGRHDVYDKWSKIEAHWIKVINQQSAPGQWVNPKDHLSYQSPKKPFEIFEEDFRKTAMDYLMFKEGIDVKEFNNTLLKTVLYSSEVGSSEGSTVIKIRTSGENYEKN